MSPKIPKTDDSAAPSLLAIYESFLVGIVRIQAGRQRLGDATKALSRWKHLLKNSQQSAAQAQYTAEEIEDARLAMVVFLDEAIQRSSDPAKDDWRLHTLQYAEYDKTIGGEVFYDRLERMERRPETKGLIDVLELYYVCLLLGYEGMYERSDRAVIMARIHERLERHRSTPAEFGIPLTLPFLTVVPDRSALASKRATVAAICSMVVATIAFVLFKLLLISQADTLASLNQT